MSFVTKAQIRDRADNAKLAKNQTRADSILKEEASVARSTYDVFLSHSYLDKDDILGIKKFIEEKGHSVYVDWIDDRKLDRTKVDKETASLLRSAMNKCACLIYAYSPNITVSRWCPWELGYFDGHNGNAFVMPIVDNQADGYTGIEYVGLYNEIVEEESQGGKLNLYVRLPTEYQYLGTVIQQARDKGLTG